MTPWQERVGHQRNWNWRGWQIRYTFFRGGEAPPVLLIHGFGASIGHWRHNLSALAGPGPVYALDLLGFGASTKAATNYNLELWVDLVHDFWQQFIGRPIVVVGNSIGSLVSLRSAQRHPEMVCGLVMFNLPDFGMREKMLPGWLNPIVSRIEQFFTAPPLIKGIFYLVRRPAVVRRWAGIAYYDRQAVTDELVEILANPAQEPGAAATFAQLFRGMSSRHFSLGVAQMLPGLNIPILLIWGKYDRMVPPSLAEAFLKMNPRLELIKLAAGHCPHDECPEQVNPILRDWLARKILCL